MMIIGISGKIGAGKDTLAGFISAELKSRGHNVYDKKFASALKKITSIITGIDNSEMYTEEGKNTFVPSYNKTVGELQQFIGTDLFRNNFDNEVWVKTILNQYEEKRKLGAMPIFIISDVRFKNEIEAIKNNHHNLTIRINGDPILINKNTTRDKTHISECDLDDYKYFDIFISNTEQLHKLKDIAFAISELIEQRLKSIC